VQYVSTCAASEPLEVVPVKRPTKALTVSDGMSASGLCRESEGETARDNRQQSTSTWNAPVGVDVTEVHLAALFERPVRLGENSGLIFAEIDDAIADNNVNAVGSNTSALQVFDHTLGECDVALVVAKGAGMVIHVSARYLLTKLSLRGSKIM
jgi:hypothetical protein